jgi:FtsJ-like methyltransferase
MPGADPSSVLVLRGRDETGDLLVADNIDAYVERTLELGRRDLVVADGSASASASSEGEDPTGQHQERASAPLVLAESLCALQVLAPGGGLVLKLHDSCDRFTADVLQLLCRHFRRSTLFKPLASRPATAERYFVGRSFTGQHFTPRVLKDLYTVLGQAAKKPPKVGSFLPKAPSVISDFIVRLNDWHARRQLSFLRWALAVDAALTQDSRARPNYPISYDLSRFYSLAGVPFVRARQGFELGSSPCQEVRLNDRVAQLAKHVSARSPDVDVLPALFAWLRYSLSSGAEDPLAWDPELLAEWSDAEQLVASEANARQLLATALEEPVEYVDEPCPALRFQLVLQGDSRVVRGETAMRDEYPTFQVTRMALTSFLTQKERERKSRSQQADLAERPEHLERAFVFLKRYEALQLDVNAFRVRYPQRVDCDMYATLLTRASEAFFSPVWVLEAPFGALGPPLGQERPPERATLALNLLYATETRLREALIVRALGLVEDEGHRLLVATLTNVPALDRSAHRRGQPVVLEREAVTNAVTGRVLDKRVLLYTLERGAAVAATAPERVEQPVVPKASERKGSEAPVKKAVKLRMSGAKLGSSAAKS